MKIQNAAVNSLLYGLYMFGSCFIIMLVESLLVYILSRFAVIPYPVLTIIRLVIYTVGVLAILAGIGYIEGYREGVCNVAESVTGGIGAMVLHVLFSLLFHFQAFVSGGVRFAAGLIAHGGDITMDRLQKETSTGLFLLLFAVYGAAYIGTLTVAKYVGARRRVKGRAELCGNAE